MRSFSFASAMVGFLLGCLLVIGQIAFFSSDYYKATGVNVRGAWTKVSWGELEGQRGKAAGAGGLRIGTDRVKLNGSGGDGAKGAPHAPSKAGLLALAALKNAKKEAVHSLKKKEGGKEGEKNSAPDRQEGARESLPKAISLPPKGVTLPPLSPLLIKQPAERVEEQKMCFAFRLEPARSRCKGRKMNRLF